MEFELCRTYYATGTNGCFFAGDELVCFTIELPWLDNLQQRSCIPEGRYSLRYQFSQQHGHHLLVEPVPGRTGILVHPANKALQSLKGCIAPVSLVTGPGIGLASRQAMQRLMTHRALRKTANHFLIIKTL